MSLSTKNMLLATIVMVLSNVFTLVKAPDHDENEQQHQQSAEELNNIAIAGIIIVTLLVTVSIAFELAIDKLTEETDEMNMPFIHTIFNELTTLGFIGLILFVLTKLKMLDSLSEKYLGEKLTLQETIEMLHMILFLFVVIFLVLCCLFLHLGTVVQNEWRSFERRVMDIEDILSEYCKALEFHESLKGKLNPFALHNYFLRYREMVYVSLRLRFLNSKSNHPDHEMLKKQTLEEYQQNRNMRFPFCEYLSIISGEVMGRLIEIDVYTWIALEVILVLVFGVIWKAGPDSERWILLGCGFFLILLNQFVYHKIDKMRKLLTPPMLFHRASELRKNNAWRKKHGMDPVPTDERSALVHKHTRFAFESTPPYILSLPNHGRDMTKDELMNAQKALLSGSGNGVVLALFSTRLVFLLTAVHLSIFLCRESVNVIKSYSAPAAVCVYFLYLLPSIVVTIMSTRIAREGLYAFNVEHMKVPRVISKVTRLLKARQTLRTLRFIAEMKVYLKGDHRRQCSQISLDLATSPRSDHGSTDSMSDRGSLASPESVRSASSVSYSPRKEGTGEHTKKKRHKRKNDPYEIEQERREINAIFCLFDKDGSGSITKQEMQSLLNSITHDMTPEQIEMIMNDLDEDNTGEISFDEFYRWCHEHIQDSSHSTEELMEEVFNMVDTDGNGEITVEEFIEIFKTLGESLDHDDVRELVYQMDRNNDGRINKEEFEKMLHKHAA